MKWIKYYLKWITYYNATQDERIEYASAQLKGCKCEGVRHGTTGVYSKYDQGKPPQERGFLNYKEFKAKWHPITGTEMPLTTSL